MKKITTILLTMLLVLSCNDKKSLEAGHYRINGTLTGMDNGKIYLMEYPKVDTIKVEKGKFTIEKELKDIVGQLTLVKDANARGMEQKSSVSLFIEPTVMNLDLDYNDFSKSKLMGSKTQDDQYRLDVLRKDIEKDYQKEMEAFDAIRKKYNEAASAGASEDELEVLKYEDNEARGSLAPMWIKQGQVVLQFIKDNPKSYISVFNLLFQLSDIKYDEAKALYDSFDPTHTNTEFGKRLLKDIEDMRKGIPGALAGNFDTVDINGNPLKLSDFKGKYLLIDFWASWCVPCRKGNPHLISLYKKYHPKGLEILGVSDDDRNHDAWRKAVEKDQIGIWHHVLRGLEYREGTHERINIEKDVSEGYNIHTLPTKILVSPDGVIVGRYGGGGGTDEDMDRDLAALFHK